MYCVSLQGGGQLQIGFRLFTSEYLATEVCTYHGLIKLELENSPIINLQKKTDEAANNKQKVRHTPLFVLIYAAFSPLF